MAYRNTPVLVLSCSVEREGLKEHWGGNGYGWTCKKVKSRIKLLPEGTREIKNLFHKAPVLLPVRWKGCKIGQAVVLHWELLVIITSLRNITSSLLAQWLLRNSLITVRFQRRVREMCFPQQGCWRSLGSTGAHGAGSSLQGALCCARAGSLMEILPKGTYWQPSEVWRNGIKTRMARWGAKPALSCWSQVK